MRAALLELWELSGEFCSRRLAPLLPEFMDVLERNDELKLRPEIKELLRRISPATIGRLLSTHRPQPRRRGGETGLEEIRHRLPFPLLGIDSDNDSAFLS